MSHHPQGIPAQNFQNVGLGVALLEQRIGDAGEHGGIIHAFGHVGAVEIRTQANVIHPCDLHRVVNVLDDFLPTHTRQFSSSGGFAVIALRRRNLARLIIAALLFHAAGAIGIQVFLTDEIRMVIDVHDAAILGQSAQHLVGHIARMIADGPA